MRSNEARPGGGARSDQRRHRPGSRPARLAEASKQLEILLEDVDLDAASDLGEALTEAVIAVDRAAELATGEADEEPEPRARRVEYVGGDHRTVRPEEHRVESDGLQFLGEAGAE